MSYIVPCSDILMVIDWVNSLDIPSCTLVDDIEDLKSGCVVADIISWLTDNPMKGLRRNVQNTSQALANWSYILTEIKEIAPTSSLCTPEELLQVKFTQNDQYLINLLNFLSGVKKVLPKDLRSTFAMTRTSENSIPSGLPPRRPNSAQKSLQETPQKLPEQSGYEPKPVAETLKEGLVKWLEEINIIRKGSISTQALPGICPTGVLFCDVVNRVEGKSEVIRGVERNPRNRTQALANINKVLEYLRSLPKMNARYLWSGKSIIDCDELVVWGLLEDIKGLYAKKIGNSALPSRPSSSSAVERPDLAEDIVLPKSFLQEKSKVLRSYSASMRRTPSHTPSMVTSRPGSSKSAREHHRSMSIYISEEMKKGVIEWVDALGIHYQTSSNPYMDSLKNGVLLCELFRILHAENIKINPSPRSSRAVFENFQNALAAFKSNYPDIPSSLLNNPGALTENSELVYSFIYSLLSIYPTAVPIEYSDHSLPYGALDIRRLENSITQWITDLNILQPPPNSFLELIPEFKTGVLLCVVLSRAFAIKIPSISRDPRTEQAGMGNIRKALDILRKVPMMSQKFVWSGKEIFKGNSGVILGILEDIHRCADGLPARKGTDEYHRDGPYLGRCMRKEIEESFNATFGSKNIEADCYSKWLNQNGIVLPKEIKFMEERIPEFASGTLLCSILAQLEKKNFNGVEKDPKKKTQALANIGKAIGVLKKKKGFPNELKNCEEEVLMGNGGVIRKIIQTMMKVYGRKG